MKWQTIKSLCSSAPFWKTLSGIKTLGLPESDRVIGASLVRVLSSFFLNLSTREGPVGIERLWGFVTEGGHVSKGVVLEGGAGQFRLGFWFWIRLVLSVGRGGRIVEGAPDALFVKVGEVSLGGIMVKDSEVRFSTIATVFSDPDWGTVISDLL